MVYLSKLVRAPTHLSLKRFKVTSLLVDNNFMLVDEKELRLHFDGDEELISELLEVFELSYPETLGALKKSIEQKNSQEVELHAHTLKGMVSNFFSKELKDAAFSLEKMGREQALVNELSYVKILEEGLPQMIKDLRSIL